MGTVGLNFGNPTSGTGFNVSTTVSELVANLQAVEKPWNSQLASLSAEDAAFSTIGTGLSNLATAYSNLTDFQGVLASKSGISSDPGVLELTAASTTAIAGSHSIVVNSLATNDSWTSSALTTLGSGNLTIQVGSGATGTIAVTNGESLTNLAASINSAGLGVQASVISNSTGSHLSLVSSTSGSGGALTIGGTATNSGASISWTNVTKGADASLTVDGNAITSSSNTVSNAIPGVTFQILASSPTTTSGGSTTATPVQVQITNDTADVTSALDLFVSAYNTVMQAITAQEGSGASGAPQPLFGNTSLATLQEQLGSMMNVTQTSSWDSSLTPVGASDTLTGTLNITVGSGTQQTFKLGAGETLAQLANSINTASSPSSGVTASVVTEAGGSFLKLVSQTGGSAGNLTVGGALTDATTSGGLAFIQTAEGSSVNSFGALGISSLTFATTGGGNTQISANPGGLLSINGNALNSALNSDYQAVVNFFQEASAVGAQFFNGLTTLGTASPSQSGGIISEALFADQQQESGLNADISNENTVISAQQAQLTAELDLANQTLQGIPTQVNEVNQLFQAITGFQPPTS
jgi:flagellar hook-associated protein 2